MRASEWAAIGVPVFPCINNPGGNNHNAPLCENGVKDATTDAGQLESWWGKWPDANIGLACGFACDVVDLDIDKKTGETVGEDYVRENFPEAWAAADVIVTSPSGGRHLFYKPGAELKNYVRSLPGVDVRTTGGYVVGVGSPGYRFSRGGPDDFATLESPPETLVAALNAKRKAREEEYGGDKPSPLVEITMERKRYAERGLAKEVDGVRTMDEGGRNARLNTAAFNIGQLIGAGALDETLAKQELTAAALESGLEREETRKTIESGLRNGKSKPRDLSGVKSAADLDDFVERFVYISDSDTVADLEQPAAIDPIPLRNFHTVYAHLNMEIEKKAPTVKDPDRTVPKTVPVSSQWVTSEKLIAVGSAYHPAKDRLMIGQHGHQTLNTYQRPDWFPDEVGDVPAEIHELLATLAPDEDDRNLLIQWMARTTHKPELRSHIIPVIVTPAQGVGKGLFSRLMEGLVGQSNTAWPKMPSLFGEFHDYLDKTTLAVVDEAAEQAENRSKFVALDSIRDVLSEGRLRVNTKHVRAAAQDVFTNFLFLSNHEDCLIVREGDRRLFVIISREPPRENAFYAKLWPLVLRPEVLGRVARWLEQFADLPFPNRAPMNTSKREMIGYATPEWSEELQESIRGKAWIGADELSGGWLNGVSNAAFGHEMRRLGYRPSRKSVSGERVRGWERVRHIEGSNVVSLH